MATLIIDESLEHRSVNSINVQEMKCLCYCTKITNLSEKSLSSQERLRGEVFRNSSIKEI